MAVIPERRRAPIPESSMNSQYKQTRERIRLVQLTRQLFFVEHLDAKLISIRVGQSEDWVRDVCSGRLHGAVDWRFAGD